MSPPSLDQMTNDQLLASAIRYLIDGGDEAEANVLLPCSLDYHIESEYFEGVNLHIVLSGPRASYDILKNEGNPITGSIWNAISAILPEDCGIGILSARAEIVDVGPNWRSELLKIVRGRDIDNVAVGEHAPRIWNNLRFRSESEVKIAQALDQVGVLFLPNCKARLGSAERRENREADFLVCFKGRWGILEVDGEPFHPASRTVEDHERDRLFRLQGISVVEHFDASDCFNNPKAVVQKFLKILGNI